MASTTNAPTNGTVANGAHPRIIDIRSDVASIELKQEILAGLKPSDGNPDAEKTLPTLLLYDDAGLKLFERITYLDQYYLTNEEIGLLEKSADRIAEYVPDDSMIVELGSGNLRKVNILLSALDRAKKHTSYYALDLMKSELERTLDKLPQYQYVKCFGLHGTYDDGLDFMKQTAYATKSKTILSLGSSIGNFTRDEAAGFVSQYINILGPQDSLLIAIDACQSPRQIYDAYNDRDGTTHEFTMNGLEHANRLLGYEAFQPTDWDAIGEYSTRDGVHRAYVVPNKNLTVEGVELKKDERVKIEESYKYSQTQADHLWRAAGATEGASWKNDAGTYGLHMLKRPPIMFPMKPDEYAADPVPTLNDWHQLWATWDLVTRQMIPEEELLSKPIKLRNACIFYLGHIPTFFDMKLTEATGGKPTEPSYFSKIFERGIDPDVDNPQNCHSHSEIPDSWPPLEDILMFQQNVRERVTQLYKSGQAKDNIWTGRAIWLGFEHEIMHMETLLYMLLQSDQTRPPAGTIKPDWEQLAAQAKRDAVDNEWIDVPEQTISLGLSDPDTGDGPIRHFGWDVEKPPQSCNVGALQAKARPITNGEYASFLQKTGKEELPASWMMTKSAPMAKSMQNGHAGHTNGHTSNDVDDFSFREFLENKAVRTVYGSVPLKYALDWPVAASYDELASCANYMGGRIPTLEETRSIYVYADTLKKEEAANALGKTIPAVNGHLVNEGVEESPPSQPSLNGSSAAAGLDPNELFVNLDEANVGFKHWHPMPVTQNGKKLAGQGDMGGLWEWTSSALEKQDGFVPMKLYPAYSADFYDDKHNVVLGGSWATHPRVAGRKTFVNWYQRNYPFAWAGARLVRSA